jgi:uncharacterized protein YggE
MFSRFFNDTKFAISVGIFGLLIFGVVLGIVLIIDSVVTTNPASFPGYRNSINVNGTGEVDVKPEDYVAKLDFTVVEAGESVSAAQGLATKKINDILNYLKSQKIEDKDIKNNYYNINPKYEYEAPVCTMNYCPPGKDKLVGYEVSQSIQVTLRNTEKVGEVLEKIGSFNVFNVGGLQFSVDEDKDYAIKAETAAIADARTNAEQIAESMGVKIVRISSYYENNQPYYGDYGMGGGPMMESVKMAPNIPQGEKTYSKTVNVTFEIE